MQQLYTDGGVIGRNPSNNGGSWAWALIEDNRCLSSASGIIIPSDNGLPYISNNVSEVYAVICGLETLPEGWDGILVSDSAVCLNRVKNHQKPVPWLNSYNSQRLTRAIDRLGKFKTELIAGHPEDTDLLRGFRMKGDRSYRVSQWNVLVDVLCNQEIEKVKPLKAKRGQV